MSKKKELDLWELTSYETRFNPNLDGCQKRSDYVVGRKVLDAEFQS